ncbi:helicase-related protein [Flavobacterium croceum]|uniref:helicase-related protein n=1 Tax=Flavobacterium croceum TaxID=370975 RepID=UPI0024A8BEF1|nr:helicase-related protein [Flavobacterium croceum]
MSINSSIRDNKKRGSVGEFLNEHIQNGSKLSIVSAYFTIYAFDKLKNKLKNIDNLNFLFGEPTFIKDIDPNKNIKRDYKIEDDKLQLPIESILQQKSVAKECTDWIKNKVKIKSMVKPNFLHGKLYHIEQENKSEKAIAGSSNFTVNGLGLGTNSNMELNIVIDSERDRNDLKNWFDDLWNDNTGLVEDVKDQVIKYLEQLYAENEPEFIYFKTLYHLFKDYLNDNENNGLLDEKTGFYETEIWDMLYSFQKDGVKGAINKIQKHNGCIIADSVGLGKTFEALAVIQYFTLLNKNILVICPKKLSENWTVYQTKKSNALSPFKRDKFDYAILYHTDLGRKNGISKADGINLDTIKWGNYHLVVIDESHNFKGNPLEKTKDDGEVIWNRPKWLLEKILKEGVDTKVLLLTATPVNNELKDLRNQISLITKGKTDALLESTQIVDIAQTLKKAQTDFTNWADIKKNPNRKVSQLIEKLDASFFKMLDELTIARSRKHIINFYKAENEVGNFPTRLKPISIYSKIDTKDRFYTYDKLNEIILEYKLSIFNPSAYVIKNEHKYNNNGQTVLNFSQQTREHFLIGMMKVNFLKRLESSIESFEISMNRTIEKIERLEQKINDFKNSKLKSSVGTLDEYEPDTDEKEETNEEHQVGKKLKFDLADLDLDKWLDDLKNDKNALVSLHVLAKDVTPDRDAKLIELKKLISQKISSSKNKKILLFTAFSDTANYLFDNLKDWIVNDLKLHTALVAGSENKTTYGKNEFNHILTNFAPMAKKRSLTNSPNQDDEISILIATDCISEGQNLQDCDYLINYDIHWNPVRLIQRFGRIDRLGSKNEAIQMVNFWPTKDLDGYINLKHRVESRMALVDLTATNDDDILNEDTIKELIEDDLKYRNQQLKRLQNEVLDLEEMEDGVDFTDFTLDDFRVELLNFLDKNKEKLENAPLGLYAVIPSPSGNNGNLLNKEFKNNELKIIQPGVIYCLRQKNELKEGTQINPLNPYFLVYVYDDGTVKYNYAQSKSILEVFRLVCQNQDKAFELLCDLFNNETQNGSDMSKYNQLLKSATTEIAKLFDKKSNAQVMNSRNGLFTPIENRITETDNFELITWLVIK